EHGVAQQLAVAHRREGEAVRSADQAHVLAPRLLLKRLERASMAILELLVDLGDAVAEMLALERGRYRRLQLLDELLHVAPEHTASARRETQGQRLAL